MFDIIPGGAKEFNVIKVSQLIGCHSTDFHLIHCFCSAWVQAFHPFDMRWFNPEGPDTSFKYSEPEYPGYRSK